MNTDHYNFFYGKGIFKKIQVKQINVQSKLADGASRVASNDDFDMAESDAGTEYAEEFKKNEEALCKNICQPVSHSTMESVDTDDNARPGSARSVSTFSIYKFDKKEHNQYAIDSKKSEILSMIDSNRTTIIQGFTGCGKTTQVPQYILDSYRNENKYCNIIVTQPRKLAAISVASRVCEERNWNLGTVVGFQVGLDSSKSDETILTYVTTGVLLHKLISAHSMNAFTHVILDEVHERTREMDFLLLVVRRYLRTVSTHVKVILMSATFDVDHFAKYFSVWIRSEMEPAPVVYVTKNTPYVVSEYYLCQLEKLFDSKSRGIIYSQGAPEIRPELYDVMVKLIGLFDRLDNDACSQDGRPINSVLVFLPGILEIEEAFSKLMQADESRTNIKWWVLPLHSSITKDEQKKVFLAAPKGHRKIILSTNIAESSITVPDIVYVIDFCLTKILVCDPTTNYTSLQLAWASHESCVQRSGRVGRVANGRVYRFVSEKFYNDRLPKSTLPEMLRCSLDSLLLYAKMLEIGEPPHGVLALAIDPPKLLDIKNTICYLKEAGALLRTHNGVEDALDGDITFFGRVMAQMPLDIKLTKLILIGHLFNCLGNCVIMAAGVSLNSVFSSPFRERMKTYINMFGWADGSSSDLIALLHVYKVWSAHKQKNLFNSRLQLSEREWCNRSLLQFRVLREWNYLVKDIHQRLERYNIKENGCGSTDNYVSLEESLYLKVAISGAFYPNYFVRGTCDDWSDEKNAVKVLGGRDPYKTVYFLGMPQNQPGLLYVKRIKELLKDCESNMKVSFDCSSKVYVEFDAFPVEGRFTSVMLGKIPLDVYIAVRSRQLKLPMKFKCLTDHEAIKRAGELGMDRTKPNTLKGKTKSPKTAILPGRDMTGIAVRVCHVTDDGHFWCQNVDEQTDSILAEIKESLNNSKLLPAKKIVEGEMYAGPFKDGLLYRVKIISLDNPLRVLVSYVDFGNTYNIETAKLFQLTTHLSNIPPLAMKCVLSEIQPSRSTHALWSDKAKSVFRNMITEKTVYAKIFSVVGQVMSVELFNTPNATDKSLNQYLVDENLAEPSEESFLSIMDHIKRIEYESNQLAEEYLENLNDYTEELEPPPEQECRSEITLKGPFSPLEMTVHSLASHGAMGTIHIDANSVNCVLLNSDMHEKHEKLVVAGHISQSPDQTRQILRHTTLLPNIRGLPALLCMLFCPVMEPKVNAEGTRICAILAGLGFDMTSAKSLFKAHDMVVYLDTELTVADFKLVNDLRYWLNRGVQALSDDYEKCPTKCSISECQKHLRIRLKQLLLDTKRPRVNQIIIPEANVWNKVLCNVQVLAPKVEQPMNFIWPFHHTFAVKKENNVMDPQKALDDLQAKVISRVNVFEETMCTICQVKLETQFDAKLHLVSFLHREMSKKALKTNLQPEY